MHKCSKHTWNKTKAKKIQHRNKILRNKTKIHSAHFSTVTTKIVAFGRFPDLISTADVIIKMAINPSTLSAKVRAIVFSAMIIDVSN